MSSDPKRPFGEFLLAVIRDARTENPGGGISDKMWVEYFDRAHKAWHALRDDKKRRSPFVPPTPAEVEAYSISIGWALNGVGFCSHYETKGWCTSGTTKMRSWQAACRKWKSEGWTTKNPPRVPTSSGPSEIPGWLEFMLKHFPNWVRLKQGSHPTWARLAPDERKMIAEKMADLAE